MFGFFENEIHVYFILDYAHNGNLYKKILNKSIDNVSAAKVSIFLIVRMIISDKFLIFSFLSISTRQLKL